MKIKYPIIPLKKCYRAKFGRILLSWCLLLAFLFPLAGYGQSLEGIYTEIDSLLDIGEYQKGLNIAQANEATVLSTIGKQTMEFVDAHNAVGQCLIFTGRYNEGMQHYREVIKIEESLTGRNTASFADHLNNLAEVLDRLGKYKEAEALALEVLHIDSITIGTNNVTFSQHLSDLGQVYISTNNFEKGEPLFLEALRIDSLTAKTKFGRMMILGDLGRLYVIAGLLDKAKSTIHRALELLGTDQDRGTMQYHAGLLNNLAEVELPLGEYESAEKHLQQALAERLLVLGDSHPEYAVTVNNMGNFYLQIGENTKAIPYLREAKKVMLTSMGGKSVDYAAVLCNLGMAYEELGDHARAIAEIEEAHRIHNKLVGPSHPNSIIILNNLAKTLGEMGKYQEAIDTLILIKRLVIEGGVSAIPLRPLAPSNLGNYYLKLGILGQAESEFQAARKLIRLLYGKEHSYYGGILNNLSRIYYLMRKFKKAAKLLDKTEYITIRINGKEHPRYLSVYVTKTLLHFGDEPNTDHMVLIDTLFELSKQIARNCIEGLNGSLKKAAWNKSQEAFAYFHSFQFPNQQVTSSHAGIGLNACYYERSLLLRSEILKDKVFREFASPELQEQRAALIALKRRWVKITESPNPADFQKRKPLQEEIDDLEVSILEQTKDWKSPVEALDVEWPQVLKNLPSGSAIVEFVRFPLISDGIMTGQFWYGAYVMRGGDSFPKFVGLFSEARLKDVRIVEPGNAVRGASDVDLASAASVGRVIPEGVQDLGKLLLSPLGSLLEGVTEIYCSPVGMLHNSPIAILKDSAGQALSSKCRIHLMGSTSDLAKPHSGLKVGDLRSVAAFGQMDFDAADTVSQGNGASDERTFEVATPDPTIATDMQHSRWMDLPGTGSEVEVLNSKLQAANVSVQAITGKGATEQVFKAMAHTTEHPSPTLLHVATHGFSYPDPPRTQGLDAFQFTTQSYRYSPDPLQRSGLVFSGANGVWMGGPREEGVEDGILTAAEIALMDLRDTRLVVLSACQSGIGEVQGSEGVYGLQRAFKLAGVEFVLATLWQVPDAETVEFMDLFYSAFLEEGLEVREAFFRAQGEMRERYRDEPYLWGGFVLFE